MSTPTTEKIDIQFAVLRLQPKAHFHWKGDIVGLYSDIGEWRSPDVPKPTEAEVYAEWDRYLEERAAKRTLREKIQAANDLDALKAVLIELCDLIGLP